jgi:hypothetical protein
MAKPTCTPSREPVPAGHRGTRLLQIAELHVPGFAPSSGPSVRWRSESCGHRTLDDKKSCETAAAAGHEGLGLLPLKVIEGRTVTRVGEV